MCLTFQCAYLLQTVTASKIWVWKIHPSILLPNSNRNKCKNALKRQKIDWPKTRNLVKKVKGHIFNQKFNMNLS